ncbi:ImmA/IrrE family metallo-endopeptidase [Corynebacterium macclintockiae]|uniref:ImmA/IrrE family metallo-endopeptidase n=1 Tax=Corynebacterium macclintockiae TaxID=2913501 RepID=UPI003EC09311
MTITCPDLHHVARQLGVTLTRHNGGVKGYYNHTTHTISTRRGMSIQQYRSTLAHELGHAHYGDHPTGHGHYDQKQEARADRYAARLLIDPQAFDTAYRWCQGDHRELADELEVTQHLLAVYMRQALTH